MNEKLIYGIQQVGLGVVDAEEAMNWYASHLGFNIKVFDDNNTATYMAPYMGGDPHDKRAIMVLNPAGGSGFELWQYTDRKPQTTAFNVLPGDIGINHCQVKSYDIERSYDRLSGEGVSFLTGIQLDPAGKKYFFIEDLYMNPIQVYENDSFYTKKRFELGGVNGCTLGVSDMEKSIGFYRDILGYREMVYDHTGKLEEFMPARGHLSRKIRRVMLTTKDHSEGRFGKFLGQSQVELVQCLDVSPRKIYENRYWGDLGYIHLCFEVFNLHEWVASCRQSFPFTVISNDSFAMGEANGKWGYLEDPDGSLIEFVETCRIPIVKVLNWYNNLETKNPNKPLADWLVRALSLKKIRPNQEVMY